MKKILSLILLAGIILLTPTANAAYMNYNNYSKLDITSAVIVGDYIFDVSEGFSPTLRDVMIASRTIPSDEPTYLRAIMMIDKGDFNSPMFYYSDFENYSNTGFCVVNEMSAPIFDANNDCKKNWDRSSFEDINSKYIYKSSIVGASAEDYTEIR